METPPLPFIPQPKPVKKIDLFDQYKYYILGVLLFITGVGVYLMLTPPASTIASDDAIVLTESLEATEVNPPSTSQVVIDVAGGVQKPGVYWLTPGAIVEDAIQAAGGFSSRADLDAIAREINRAGKLEANAKVYLPRKGDPSIVLSSSPGSTSSPITATSLINLNTAGNAELDLLPGVGPVTAQRIIDYRLKNGNFKSLDDLKKVAGISEAKFNQMKDLITI